MAALFLLVAVSSFLNFSYQIFFFVVNTEKKGHRGLFSTKWYGLPFLHLDADHSLKYLIIFLIWCCCVCIMFFLSSLGVNNNISFFFQNFVSIHLIFRRLRLLRIMETSMSVVATTRRCLMLRPPLMMMIIIIAAVTVKSNVRLSLRWLVSIIDTAGPSSKAVSVASDSSRCMGGWWRPRGRLLFHVHHVRRYMRPIGIVAHMVLMRLRSVVVVVLLKM